MIKSLPERHTTMELGCPVPLTLHLDFQPRCLLLNTKGQRPWGENGGFILENLILRPKSPEMVPKFAFLWELNSRVLFWNSWKQSSPDEARCYSPAWCPHGGKWIFPQTAFGLFVYCGFFQPVKGSRSARVKQVFQNSITAQRKLFANILGCEWDLQ